MDLAHCRLTPDFTFICFWWSMNCVSCDICACVYHLGLLVFFPGVFLSSRVNGACPVTTDLVMRVNVRTAATTTTTAYTAVPGTRYDTCLLKTLLYTSPSPTTTNHKHIYDSIPRLLRARQSFGLTQTRQQLHHHHRNHHRHTIPAPQQQHSSSTAAETAAEAVVT